MTTSPAELEQVHREFIRTYSTTAYQGLRKESFDPPIPIAVLAEAKGRIYSQDGLVQNRELPPTPHACDDAQVRMPDAAPRVG